MLNKILIFPKITFSSDEWELSKTRVMVRMKSENVWRRSISNYV
jgi:hypothetical protein